MTRFKNDTCHNEQQLIGLLLAHKELIEKFLNVPELTLSSPLVKLSTRSLAETLINYNELRERFAGTRWACFFDE